jgi:hypothetical protein
VKGLVSAPPLASPTTRPRLVVDQTGVGAAVVEMVRAASLPATLTPVLVTAGSGAACTENGWNVAKKELVSVLQVLLQTRRLKIAAVPDREILVRELDAFRVKVTAAANETYESWRERDHDDMVLALAFAAWAGEQFPPPGPIVVLPDPPRPPVGLRALAEWSAARRGWRGPYGALPRR